MLYNLCILDRSGSLLLSYYFAPASVEDQDRWEADLATSTKALWEPAFAGDVSTVVAGRYVLLRGQSDMVFILSGVGEHDELAREYKGPSVHHAVGRRPAPRNSAPLATPLYPVGLQSRCPRRKCTCLTLRPLAPPRLACPARCLPPPSRAQLLR
jgi:hypothetical protein